MQTIVERNVSGIGLPGALFLLFTGLKLTGYIDWSWWWVTAPLWLIPAIALAVFAVMLLLIMIGDALDRRAKKKRRAKRESL